MQQRQQGGSSVLHVRRAASIVPRIRRVCCMCVRPISNLPISLIALQRFRTSLPAMAALWQAARASVSEFEHRTSGLALTLATEKEALQGVQRETERLEAGANRVVAALPAPPPLMAAPAFPGSRAERDALMKHAQEAEAKKMAAVATTAELRAAAERATTDSGVLQKHVELLRAGRQDASVQMEQDRLRYDQHIAALRAQLHAFEAVV